MADNRQNLLNEISDGLKGIRDAINNSSNVTIPEDTPLQDYKDYIEKISQTRVDIGKQIFVFYTWAKTTEEAEGYAKPSIHWNSETNDGWTVQETNDWKLNEIPDNSNVSGSEPADTYYTFVMFVSLSIEDSTGDDFDWPTPVQISGSKGEKGDTGLPGRDGVVAGMVLYKTVNLYINSSDKPEIEQGNITFDKENQDIYEIFANDLKINGIRVKDEVEEDDVSGQWYSKYPSATYEDMIWMIKVSFKSDNDNTTPEKSPILLTQPVLVADSIMNVTAKYSYSNEGSNWFDTPLVPDIDNQTCYVKYIITTKYGTTFETTPGVYSKFPKSISNVTYEYGTSVSTAIIPNIWSTTYPDMTSDVIWIQRTEEFSNDDIQTVQYPIGLRGPSGIQFIASVESENDLSSISPIYDNNYIGKLGVRVGQNVYVWYGTEDPNLTGIVKKGNCYWLNVGPLSPIPDWNVKEGESGYVKNRTHYVQLLTETKELYSGSLSIPGNTKGFVASITVDGQSYTTDYIDVESGRTGSYYFTGWDSDYIYVDFESKYIEPMGDNVGMSLYVYVTFDIWDYHKLDPKFVPQMIEISYADLKNLRDTNQLIPGMQYRIIDYETSVSIGEQMSAKHPFDLIVTADSVNTINCKAKAVQSVRDTSGYFTNSDLSKWDIWYTLDMSDVHDKIIYSWTWFREEQSGVYIDNQRYDIDYTSEVSAVLAEKLIYSSGITTDNFLNTSGNFYIAEPPNYHQYIYKIYDCDKLFVYDTSMFAAILNQTVLSVVADTDNIYLRDGNNDPIVKINFFASNHKIDNVRVCDHNNTLLSARKVVSISISNFPEEFYVTDECVSALLYYINSNNSTWDGFKQQYPDWYKSFGYLYTIPNKKVAIPMSEYDPDFLISDSRYFKKYDELKTGNMFKGTIYRMIDEFGNDCPYDFKNILLKKSNTYYYTFDKNLQDGSLDGLSCNNKIESCLSEGMMTLPFINLIYSGKAAGNVFGKNSENITLTSYTYEPKHGSILNWTVGCNCKNINCKEIREDSSLVIGNNCSDITFNNLVIQTIIGNNCSDITFNDVTTHSIIGNNCSDITCEYADSVIIKDMCSDITITSLNVTNLIIEPQCQVMTFDVDFNNCLIESQCRNVTITGTYKTLTNCVIARQRYKTHNITENKSDETIK